MTHGWSWNVIRVIVLKCHRGRHESFVSRGVECQMEMSHIDTCGARVSTLVAIFIQIDWQQVNVPLNTARNRANFPPITHQ